MTFASKLNQRISIRARGVERDAAGQTIETWSEFAAAWASVRGTGGMEAIRAGAVTATRQASFRLRARSGLTTAMRVVHKGVTYEIKAVLPDLERNVHVDLVCEAVS